MPVGWSARANFDSDASSHRRAITFGILEVRDLNDVNPPSIFPPALYSSEHVLTDLQRPQCLHHSLLL